MRLRALTMVIALAVSAPAATGAYTVRWGDTLSHLARRFGVSVDALAGTNGIADVHRIRAGSSLRLPGGAAGPPAAAGAATHTVQPGETLASLARRYGTTVSALAAANGIGDARRLLAGTRLTIPGRAAAEWLCPVRGHRTAVNNWGAPRPGWRRHQGNDIFAPRGARVVAPVAGTLRHVSGPVAGRAFYLAGADGTTYYGAHLDGYVASAGPVAAGQVIGLVGNTGNARSTPPHLHFEIHPRGGGPVNPWPVLTAHC